MFKDKEPTEHINSSSEKPEVLSEKIDTTELYESLYSPVDVYPYAYKVYSNNEGTSKYYGDKYSGDSKFIRPSIAIAKLEESYAGHESLLVQDTEPYKNDDDTELFTSSDIDVMLDDLYDKISYLGYPYDDMMDEIYQELLSYEYEDRFYYERDDDSDSGYPDISTMVDILIAQSTNDYLRDKAAIKEESVGSVEDDQAKEAEISKQFDERIMSLRGMLTIIEEEDDYDDEDDDDDENESSYIDDLTDEEYEEMIGD